MTEADAVVSVAQRVKGEVDETCLGVTAIEPHECPNGGGGGEPTGHGQQCDEGNNALPEKVQHRAVGHDNMHPEFAAV